MLKYLKKLLGLERPIVINCFDETNYEQARKYCRWKAITIKTTQHKFEGYELDVNEAQELLFKKEGYTIFKITAQNGLVLLPIKSGASFGTLEQKAQATFCKLVKTATVWGVQYNDHVKEQFNDFR